MTSRAALVVVMLAVVLVGCGRLSPSSSQTSPTASRSALALTNAVLWSPLSIDFGNVPAGTSVDRAFTATNGTAIPFSVASIDKQPSVGDLYLQNGCTVVQPNEQCQITVRWKPIAQYPWAVTLFVHTNEGDFRLTVTGTATFGTSVAFEPMRFDFGTVTIGQSVQIVVTATNHSTTDMTLFKGSPMGPLADVAGLSTNVWPACNGVAPGRSCTFNVAWQPPAPVSLAGERFVVNDAGIWFELPMTGIAQWPGNVSPSRTQSA